MGKLIRISDESYKDLFDILSYLQFVESRPYTFDSVIKRLVDLWYEKGHPLLVKEGKKPEKAKPKKVVQKGG
jgi:hypothetical protein